MQLQHALHCTASIIEVDWVCVCGDDTATAAVATIALSIVSAENCLAS